MVLPNAAGSNDKQAFLQALKDTLSDFYNKEPGTNLEKLYSALATILSLTDREISALRNDNVLSAVILDEVISRGITALDHLSQEGVFNIERVGFTPTTFVRQELHRIEKNTTTIIMNYVPVNFRTIQIFNSQDSDRIMVSQVLNFDEATNSIQVAGVAKPGLYTFQYVDTGNVKSETEDLVVPAEVFLIGFGEGGFGNYGFGE
jgi:hypothetical protein